MCSPSSAHTIADRPAVGREEPDGRQAGGVTPTPPSSSPPNSTSVSAGDPFPLTSATAHLQAVRELVGNVYCGIPAGSGDANYRARLLLVEIRSRVFELEELVRRVDHLIRRGATS